ncbi:MAG: CRTAC1 family protein [Planctomycetes bacterium]|nr:CRTAC1 family protein [Planctomycetota bacterium]
MSAISGCESSEDDPSIRDANHGGIEKPWFIEIAEQSGLDFVHTTGATGEYFFPEIAGSGCGLFDYDNDGDLDVYLLQSFALTDIDEQALPSEIKASKGRGNNRLYRNDLQTNADGSTQIKFVDVTDQAGVGDQGYAMGMAVGDIDNDGDLDLYVTNFGPNKLYLNNADGTFTDVSAAAIDSEDRWSTSASFFDYNKDGYLDLFVANYVNFSIRENKICHSAGGRRDYCGPQTYNAVPDRLFANNGDGTFRDVTEEAGINLAFGSGLGVMCADFNNDNWPDIYVANDGNANQLWINQGDGTFINEALLAGAAYNADGMSEAGMGVSGGDYDLDGDLDIFLSHLLGEHNTLLVNDGNASFDDRTEQCALASMSWPYTGFGTAWVDIDCDGDLDVFVANGAVKIVEELATQANPYGNLNQLALNSGPPNFTFTNTTSQAGVALELVETSRGAAFGDIDNDGDIDILISNRDGPVRLLINQISNERSWITFSLIAKEGNPNAIGADVKLIRNVRNNLHRYVHADSSYLSANDLRLHFGLGADKSDQTIEVLWPSGLHERFTKLSPMQIHKIIQGRGEVLP